MKLINGLSWDNDVTSPIAVDADKTIYRLRLDNYGWTKKTWETVVNPYPYGIVFDDKNFAKICEETGCDIPYLRIDWFIANAALPPLYHSILDLPSTDQELEAKLNVDVATNIDQSAGVRVWRSGFTASGVSNNNRIIERHKALYGAYWKSYDFENSIGVHNIKR